jgi:hypothetical protein
VNNRLKPTRVKDPTTARALRSVADLMPNVSVFDGCRLIEGVELESGVTKRIAHGLGRRLRGWLVVRIDSGTALGFMYDEQADNASLSDTFLFLRAEGYSPTISLLVF